MRIVEHHCVVGLAKGAFLARAVDAVTHVDVFEHLLKGRRGVALGAQLVKAALGAYLGACRSKHLHLGIGEYHRADVAAVHHHALVLAHGLLLLDHLLTHKADGSNDAHHIAHAHRADVALHVLAVQAGHTLALLGGTESDGYHPALQVLTQCLLVNFLTLDELVAQCIQCHCAVHRARVHIGIADAPCQCLGHRALAGRRMPVNRNRNLLCHCFLINVDYLGDKDTATQTKCQIYLSISDTQPVLLIKTGNPPHYRPHIELSPQ